MRNKVVHDRVPLGDRSGFERDARDALKLLLSSMDSLSESELDRLAGGAEISGRSDESENDQWLRVALDKRNDAEVRVIAVEALAAARESTRMSGWLLYFAENSEEACSVRVAAVKSLAKMRTNVMTNLLKLAKMPTAPSEVKAAVHEALRSLGGRRV